MQLVLVPGGIGLFLVGMIILTDGLKRLAGDALRRWLANFTTTTASGIVSGAIATAIVQSSSATTVAAVGFVGAGLLTFPQALGIIFGANIGTTMTGWLVALLGFKLDLGTIVQPLVLLGVVLRLFGRGPLRDVGWALAGFGLLFIAIDMMKLGMTHFEGVLTPDVLPDDSVLGRFKLVLIGMVITVVTQSSSAGVAVALVALGSGSIALPQAAAMVIGMDVGTTFTAALATAGGSTATRRTGFAHVLYNVLTGVMAFMFLDVFSAIAGHLKSVDAADDQVALVAFHTSFNALGALIVLPLAQPFADLIARIVPERGPRLQRRIDDRLLEDPASAIDAAAATTRDIALAIADYLGDQLDPSVGHRSDRQKLAEVGEALEATRFFLGRIRTDPQDRITHRRHVAAVHILDHLFRLAKRCEQQERIVTLQTDPELCRLASVVRHCAKAVETEAFLVLDEQFDNVRERLRDLRRNYREQIVEDASAKGASAESTIQRLDAVRWLHRVAYHLWRIVHHLNVVQNNSQSIFADMPPLPPTQDELDIEED